MVDHSKFVDGKSNIKQKIITNDNTILLFSIR